MYVLCDFTKMCWEISGALARTLRQQEYMGIAMACSGTEWHEVAWHFFDAFVQHRGVSQTKEKGGSPHIWKAPSILVLFDFMLRIYSDP